MKAKNRKQIDFDQKWKKRDRASEVIFVFRRNKLDLFRDKNNKRNGKKENFTYLLEEQENCRKDFKINKDDYFW